ncbi:MAG: rhomboid family intramembrane serine protease [Acidobacteriia bacterium]|nr:rhomboid family intramembrane serine protease [Terriglobia bacterium]
MTVCTQCGRDLEPSRAAAASTCPECATTALSSAEPKTAGPVLTPRTPVPITLLLVGINVLLFIAMVVKGVSVTQPTSDQILRWGANFGPLTLQGQWWRLLTAMFVHIGIVHLALNMWALWNLGMLAEYLYGPKTFLALYLLSGLAASLVSIGRNPLAVSAGASGAIFGLAGALIATLYLAHLPTPRSALRSGLVSLIVFAGYSLVYGFLKGGIDNGAHVGGLVSGLLLGSVLSKDFPRQAPRSSPIRPILFPAFAVLLVVGIVAVRYVHMPVVRLDKAEQDLRKGDNAAAMRELNEVVKARPKYAAAWALMGTVYARNREPDKAEAAFQRAAQLQPDSPVAWKQLGLLYLQNRRYEQAKAIYQKLAQLSPKDADVRLKLGFVQAELGDSEAALASFRNATSLAPNLPATWFNFGLAAMNLKHYDDAVEAFTRETKLAPRDAEAWIWLANAYQAKGMTDKADAAYLTGYRLRAAMKRPAGR